MKLQFGTAKRILDELVDESLTISLTKSERSTRGDIAKVANFECVNKSTERFDTEQHTVRIQNDDGEYYAEVIIHILDEAPAALIDWVEVVDDEHRGHDIGRTLHEEAVNYIDQKTKAERIYTKLQNTRMQSVNIDTGFEPIKRGGDWYRRE